jgi:hypothetical protein
MFASSSLAVSISMADTEKHWVKEHTVCSFITICHNPVITSSNLMITEHGDFDISVLLKGKLDCPQIHVLMTGC